MERVMIIHLMAGLLNNILYILYIVCKMERVMIIHLMAGLLKNILYKVIQYS